jgi:hypothetical protein
MVRIDTVRNVDEREQETVAIQEGREWQNQHAAAR